MAFNKMQKVSKQTSEVSAFYGGKSVFITGTAGFLGTVILETLLRCCPGICKIFILLRPKNGLDPEDRKAKILKKEIFCKLNQDNPTVLKKVVVIPGDITQENLGMDEDRALEIIQDVSIVFHCAASISFFKPINILMKHNVEGTDNVIDFCHKLRKLEALVYTSTLYSNTNRTTDIDETIYRMPFKSEKAVELSRKGDIDGLNSLFACFNPPFYNFYTFTKCVCENLLADKACDLPVTIIRPSIITCCMKGPMPGYIEAGSIIVNLSLGVGKGFIRVGQVFDHMKVDFITADVAANTHIVAAYLQASKSLPSPSIYNCTYEDTISWEDWFFTLMDMVKKYPIPNSYLIPSVTLCKSTMSFKFHSLLYHYLPAIPIDILLWLSGIQFRMLKTYQFYERSYDKAKPFLKGQWNFRCENFKSLPAKLNPRDAEIFCVDLQDFSLEKFAIALRNGCPFYRINNKPYEEKLWSTFLRYFLTYLIRCFVLGSIAFVFYKVFF